MSGRGSLTKAGGGTLVLSGANSYTGGTTVTSGTLEGDTTSLQGQIGNNATVAFNESGSGTYSDLMFGSGQLRKIGAGTLTLSGANSYRGATTVSTGALYVEGNQASATGSVTVDQGATLGGKGTIGGATTINGNHLIGQSAADDAAGIQSFSRSLTYRPGAQAFWRLTDNTTDIGTEGNYTYDRAVVGTSLVASNAQSFTFSMAFNANGSTVDWSNAFWDQEYTGTAGWLVYDATSLSITGTLAPTSDLLDSQGVELSTVRPDYSFVFYRDNAEGNVYLNYIYSP
jgi:autotransporter-associated beta strand protein